MLSSLKSVSVHKFIGGTSSFNHTGRVRPRSLTKLSLIFLCIFFLREMSMAAATNYYVDNTNPNAEDNNAGTIASLPWRTIGKAAAANLVAGDTVIVGPGGTYNELVVVSKSGTNGNPITFHAAAGPQPKVQAFKIDNQNYVTIDGFELTDIGMSMAANVCFLGETPSICVNLGDAPTGDQIINNYIHDTVFTGILPWKRKLLKDRRQYPYPYRSQRRCD